MEVRNENITKQLITRIINKLSGVKPFIKIMNFDKSNTTTNIINYKDDKKIEYQCSSISVSVNDMEHNLDNYSLIVYLLDQIILDLTNNIETKSYYCIKETIYEDIWEIIEKLENVEWYASYDTHLEYLSMIDPDNKIHNWTTLEINGKEIKSLDTSFPKSVIFGSEYPIIINSEQLSVETYEDINKSVIRIPYYYVDDYYAIRLITDERKRKVFLRKKKIDKLKGD